jgi:hypothetical protein
MSTLRVHCAGKGWLTMATDGSADALYRFGVSSDLVPEFSLPAARDLLRIGQAAFLADRAFRRGPRLGQRTRDLRVVVPVEDPKLWCGLAGRINGLAGFVSQDRWQFEFVRQRAARPRKLANPGVRANACVSLFSGGLDSLCGAAAALRRGDAPIFVTHVPPGGERVAATVTKLREVLGPRSPEAGFVGFQFQASDRTREGERSRYPERTRRTRPMLYLCLAGAVALECRVSRIYLNENGVLAINLPFQPHLNGALVSRHAHPGTLRRFESLLREVWDGREPPAVTNPFASQTKGEQLAILGPALPLAQKTISCEYAGQQIKRVRGWLKDRRRPYEDVVECGLCYPCLVRRAAMRFAGALESVRHYAFDVGCSLSSPAVYREYPLYGFVESNARDLRDFCDRMQRLSPAEFVVRYAAQLALSAESGTPDSKMMYELYQRFATEASAVLVGK